MSEYSASAKPNGLRKSLHDVGLSLDDAMKCN